MEGLMKLFVVLASVMGVLGQESISMHDGLVPHVGLQALIALVICFTILGSCAVTVNLFTARCAKHAH